MNFSQKYLKTFFSILALCFLNTLIFSNTSQFPVINFEVPDLRDENIIEVVYDLRPIRQSGVRIEPVYERDKLVIHNYGYGGYGLSLCFGGALEVLKFLKYEQSSSQSLLEQQEVAVLGAGVIGLATAYELAKEGYKVNIYADKFYPNTTSYIAAGIWTTPFFRELKTKEKIALYNRMIRNSERRYIESLGNDPEFKGVWLDTYYIMKGFLPYQRLAKFGHRVAENRKFFVGNFENGLQKKGTAVRLLSMDGKVFLTDLIKKLQNCDTVQFQKHKFETKDDVLALKEKILINCTSLGSEKLFNDTEFMPVQGHMIHFKNPKKIKYTMFFEVREDPFFWISINTWEDRLILGGVIENSQKERVFKPLIKEKLLKYARGVFREKNL